MKKGLILREVLKENGLSEEEMRTIDNAVRDILKYLNQKAKKYGKKVEFFIGGSYAKKTMVKKDRYDIDIFVRFDKSLGEDKISYLAEKMLKGMNNVSKIHGSRDYFRIKLNNSLEAEIVPVLKIKKPEDAKNITDLSYSHVKYINKKIKNKKILDEIKIAKIFCHANNCYGAESYINGFSGYALELLVYYYKGFMKMVKELSKEKKEKIIIDLEKHYKNKKEVLLDINSSKLKSPIILVDPTYPQRNALAALSEETFRKFKEICRSFLKNPSKSYFEPKKINLDKIKNDALRKKQEFILIEVSTNKQEGDIAGSKLLKFYNHLTSEIGRFFEIKNKGFNYNDKKSARYFFVATKRKEIIYGGPFVKDLKNATKFRKEHKNVSEKGGKLYAKEIVGFDIKNFINKWEVRNKKKIKEMSISKIKII